VVVSHDHGEAATTLVAIAIAVAFVTTVLEFIAIVIAIIVER